MSKLYIGNLPNDIDEVTLKQVFVENKLPCGTILIKRGGYAFVDCLDQSIADKAIDMLNGREILGAQILVEPSVAETIRKRPTMSSDQEKQLVTS